MDGRPFPRLYCFVSNLDGFLDSRLRGNDRIAGIRAGRVSFISRSAICLRENYGGENYGDGELWGRRIMGTPYLFLELCVVSPNPGKGSLPFRRSEADQWVKCDMINTVAYDRLDRLMVGKEEGRRVYETTGFVTRCD